MTNFEAAEGNQAQTGSDTEALTAALHECWPGGPIVSNPADCGERDTWRNKDDASSVLPSLEITGLSQPVSDQAAQA